MSENVWFCLIIISYFFQTPPSDVLLMREIKEKPFFSRPTFTIPMQKERHEFSKSAFRLSSITSFL
jgi:hypothetical protein